MFFRQYQDIEIVENVFKGIRPAVIALILTPTLRLAKQLQLNRFTVWVPLLTALLIYMLGVSPVWIIAFAIVLTVIYYIYKNRKR